MELKTSCPFTEARKVLSLASHNQALRHVYIWWQCCKHGHVVFTVLKGPWSMRWWAFQIKYHCNLIILYRACVSLVGD